MMTMMIAVVVVVVVVVMVVLFVSNAEKERFSDWVRRQENKNVTCTNDVCRLLNIPATCRCILRTVFLRQLYVQLH